MDIELYETDTTSVPKLLAVDLKKMGVKGGAGIPTLVEHFNRQEDLDVASEAFRKLMDKIVPTSPEHIAKFLFDAVTRLCNSYVWTGGVPDMRSGRIVDVCSNADWFVFLDKPGSNHIPLPLRIEMAKIYLGRALEKHIANAAFWRHLVESLPQSCPGGPLLQQLGSV